MGWGWDGVVCTVILWSNPTVLLCCVEVGALTITQNADKKEALMSKFKCSVCDYISKSSNGLRMHMNGRHSKYDTNGTSF